MIIAISKQSVLFCKSINNCICAPPNDSGGCGTTTTFLGTITLYLIDRLFFHLEKYLYIFLFTRHWPLLIPLKGKRLKNECQSFTKKNYPVSCKVNNEPDFREEGARTNLRLLPNFQVYPDFSLA